MSSSFRSWAERRPILAFLVIVVLCGLATISLLARSDTPAVVYENF